MKKLSTWRIVLVLSLIVYLILNAYAYLSIEDTLNQQSLSTQSALTLLLLKATPIILFFPWLLKPNYKASLFFCMTLLLYFAYCSIKMFAPGLEGQIAIIEGIVLSLLFSAAVVLGKLHKE